MKRQNWMLIEHTPKWFSGLLPINERGDTRPGFICCHELENGNGLCGANIFETEREIGTHSCIVRLRGRWNISRPCYDKPHRCPGWVGGGWKSDKVKLCHGKVGYVGIDYTSRWWRWKFHRCNNCKVVVLPFVVRWTSWRTWKYVIQIRLDNIKYKFGK